jgi:hypothetical protein
MEECSPCKQMLGAVVAVGICERAHKEGLDCKQLTDDLINKRITTKEFIEKLKLELKDEPENLLIIEKVEKILT